MIVRTPGGGRMPVKADPFQGGYQTTSARPGGGLVPLIGRDLAATYAGLYRTQPWLAAAVNKIKNGIAVPPLQTFRFIDEENRERDRTIPPARLLGRRANEFMSSFRFKEWLGGDLALYGNFVARKVGPPTGTGEGAELWPVPWPSIEIQGRGRPELYIFHSPLGPIPFPATEAIHLRWWSAVHHTDPLYGTAPVEPLRRTLMNEDAGARWVTSLFQNSARPSGIVSTEQKLNAAGVDLIRSELERLYGSVDQAFRIAVMQGGLKWQATAFSAVEAELVNLRKLQREEVAAVFDIPPPLLQILDRATFSNITEQHRMFYQETMPPWFGLITSELQLQLLDPWGYEDHFLEFELGQILRGTPKERAEAYTMFRRIYTLDELRRKENLPPIGGDLGGSVWMPVNEIPVGPNAPMPSQANAPALVLVSSLERVERYAAARLGAGRNGFDRDRFARELCKDLGRDDEAIQAWASEVGQAVEEALHGAETPAELSARMAALRTRLVQPEVAANPATAPADPPREGPITVNVAPPSVEVTIAGAKRREVVRDANGDITGVVEVDE